MHTKRKIRLTQGRLTMYVLASMKRRIRILAAAVAGLVLLGMVAVPLARACAGDSGLVLFDGELPGGG